MELESKLFKKTTIGNIPIDWEIDSIKNLADIKTGSRNTQDRILDGIFPFFVRSQNVERINTYTFDGEAVLTAGDGVGVGKVMHYINGKFDCHQRVYRISNFSKRLNGYYFFLYFSNNFLMKIMQMTAKSSVDSVRMDMISDMQIPLPPLPEQAAIAEALSDMDALIAQTEKLIEKKKAIKQGVMQELLSGRTRLAGFEKNKGYKQTEVGVIPEDWEVKQFGFICAPSKQKINPIFTSNQPCIELEDLSQETGRLLNLSDSKTKVSLKTFFSKDQVLFGKLRPYLKKYYYTEFEGVCSTEIWALVPNEGIYSRFVFYLVQSNRIIDSANISTGTKMPRAEWKTVSETKIPLPPLPEQTAIAEALSDMNEEINLLETKLQKLKLQKQGMMQALLTGKIRLGEWGIENGKL